ncbi:MAG: glutathione S-transferase family protein [Rhizobiaceae bacterium]|nr:glutathione S-transferase family protein [Rhizobiaceae bacterium]
MYRLYGSLGSGSAAVEAALAETGASYEVAVIDTKEDAHLSETFRRINPRQQVPALQLPDGSVMTEGSAMLLHLADAFPEADLAPRPGTPARAQHDRWLIFAAVNIYEGELRHFYPDRYGENAASIAETAVAYIERHYGILEDAIAGPFFFGDRISMLDLYLWNLATWMDPERLAARFPKVHALMTGVRTRPLVAPIDAAHSE